MGHRTRRNTVLLAPIAVCLAACIWALLGSAGCSACGGLEWLAGGADLAALGAFGYGMLLLAGLYLATGGGDTPAEERLAAMVRTGMLAAAGIHFVLLLLLLKERLFCPPCVLAGAGALAGVLVVLLQSRRPKAPDDAPDDRALSGRGSA